MDQIAATNYVTIRHPATSSERASRDFLLAQSLRDQHPIPWPYSSEYPLVLSSDSLDISWCVYDQGQLVAHANLWPRQLFHISDQTKLKIGLVGNVATHPDHRGRGYMATLLSHLAKIAQDQNLEALILWSDLLEFYQKYGYTSIGRELRMTFTRTDHRELAPIELIKTDALGAWQNQDLASMLAMRPKVEWTLERSLDEFRTLLTIPETQLFVLRPRQRIDAWFVMGKGADMRGVIHEWGAKSPEVFLTGIRSFLSMFTLDQVILLTPKCFDTHWLNPLRSHAAAVKEHPMVMALGSSRAVNALAKGFIWGLDSI